MIRVLIVEDDPMVAEFNKRYLSRVEGFQLVAAATSVKEALDILNSQEINLILLDVFMPGKNGLELLAQIRKMGKAIDVIIISAASDIQSVKKALRYGAVDYLIKPFEFERFQTALSSYREDMKFMNDQEVVSQEELDKRIFYRDHQSTVHAELPKGLTKNTLKMVWEHIQEFKGVAFSTEELANNAGISRVSMRKYLNFLNDIGILDTEIIYGSVGRPVYKHRCKESKGQIIKNYL